MTKTYEWAGKSGQVEMTVETTHKTSKTVWADGYDVEVPCSEWSYEITSLKYKGEETPEKEPGYCQGIRAIRIGTKGVYGLYVVYPDKIYNEIHADEIAEREAEYARQAKSDAAYNRHCEMMRRANGGR